MPKLQANILLASLNNGSTENQQTWWPLVYDLCGILKDGHTHIRKETS